MSSPVFRKIRPSQGQGRGESSSSTGLSNNQSTADSSSTTGTDPRFMGGSTATMSGSASKRRRVPDTVTRNACQACKKARSKCDGGRPCVRCSGRKEDCLYEKHIKYAKEELVKDIKELRVGKKVMERIFEALSRNEQTPEVLERLRSRETYESIVNWLGPSNSHSSAQSPGFEALSPMDSHHSFGGSDFEMEGTTSRPLGWTTVTSNQAILHHLFQLYFAWVHPVHTLFSEGHFTDSYQKKTGTFCSPVLVNAICAMACLSHTGAERDEKDFERLGVEFSEAARADIGDEDQKKVTTIQAFAVLFLVDCARSNAPRAVAYLKIATDALPNVAVLNNEGYNEALKSTVRGIRFLNVEWAQATFQVPPTITSPPFSDIEMYDERLDEAFWHFYRCVTDSVPAWPGLLATTNREKSKLVDIISDAATMMYSSQGEKVAANDVLHLYSRFVTWRDDLPASIGDIEGQRGQALPHVLSLLILYSNAVIQVLRPLLDYEGFPSSLIEDIVWNNAQQGLFLLDEHYRTQFTCRYQPVLQVFGVLNITDVICRFFRSSDEGRSKNGALAMEFGMEVLVESATVLPVVGVFQELLRRTAQQCSLVLPRFLTEQLAPPRWPKQRYGMDDFIDACNRPSYVQPTDAIHSRYLDSFSNDWKINGRAYGFLAPATSRLLQRPSAEEQTAQTLMQISNLMNPSC